MAAKKTPTSGAKRRPMYDVLTKDGFISRPYLEPLGAKSANATKLQSAVKQVAALRKVK